MVVSGAAGLLEQAGDGGGDRLVGRRLAGLNVEPLSNPDPTGVGHLGVGADASLASSTTANPPTPLRTATISSSIEPGWVPRRP